MTTPSIDLNLILSQLKLNDIQQQQQQDEEQQENLGQLLNRESLLQRLHSMDGLYNVGPSGRRLLGRSLTSPTSNLRIPGTQPQAHLPLDATAEDTILEAPEAYRTHRKLDRSVSEPHPNVFSARSALQQQTSVSASSSSSSSSSRYKTELCRPFEESGSCKYGEKCQFAHGREELRTVARHPKYKTDLCKTYHTTGLCPYGPRCHFIHNDDERYLNVINRVLLQQQMSDSIEKAQLFQKQQAIAAALASQKAIQQQQQQQQGTARRASLRQISSDSTSCSDQTLSRLPFLSYPASDPLGSLSDSPSSSITDSPAPSPTSSLFNDDPVNGTSATLGAYTNPKHSVAAFDFTPGEVKSFQAMYQRQQQQQQQQLGQVGESSPVSPSTLSLLLAKLTQPEILGLIECLVQKSTSPSLPTPSTHCNSLPPVSPRIDLTADWHGDFTSREGTCYSWPYSAVEL